MIGMLSKKTKLEQTLEQIHVPYDKYIFYTKVKKPVKKFEYTLILAVESFFMINESKKKIKEYKYMDIESVRNMEHKPLAFLVSFYKKDPKIA